MSEEKSQEKQSGATDAAPRLPVPISWLLRLYPRAWREHYAEEMAVVLAGYHITLWTALDLLLGALDAHVHHDLLPDSFRSLSSRLRSSEIVIFCAFLLFCLTWIALRFVRDPLPAWYSATSAHPELLTLLNLLDVAGSVATLAVLVGGVPLVLSALFQAIAARHWRVPLLFVAPIGIALVLGFATIFLLPASTVHQSSVANAPFTPLAVALQFGLLLLWLLGLVGSAAAVALALASSPVSERIVRFALLPARLVILALVLGLVSALLLTLLIFKEAPQVASWSPLHIGDLLLMALAVLLAGLALRHGLQAVSTETALRKSEAG